VHPVFSCHPGSTDIAGKSFDIKSGKSFGRDDERRLICYRKKIPDKILCALPIAMKYKPEFFDLGFLTSRAA